MTPASLASFTASSVSAVSPDCEMTMRTSSLKRMGLRSAQAMAARFCYECSESNAAPRLTAELARVLDLDRHAGKRLDRVLPDEAGVEARAAGGDDDAACIREPLQRFASQAAEAHGAGLDVHAPSNAVVEDNGLRGASADGAGCFSRRPGAPPPSLPAPPSPAP